MSSKHVLIVCEKLIPNDVVSEQAMRLANHFASLGDRVTLLCGAERDAQPAEGVELVCMARRLPRLMGSLIRFRRWQAAMRTKLALDYTVSFTTLASADLVIPCEGTMAGYVRCIRRLHAPLPARVSAWAESIMPRILFRLFAEKRALQDPATRVCVALSSVIHAELQGQIKAGHVQLQLVELPVQAIDQSDTRPEELREQIARAFNIDEGSAWLVFPFGSAWIAGIEPLLLAFRALVDSGADATLLLAGRTRYTHLAWIAQLGLREHIRFVGRSDHPEQLFSVADLIVMPTSYDPGGWQARMALASGKPLLTTRASGAAEMIQRQRGVLLDNPVDPSELAAALMAQIQMQVSANDPPPEAQGPPDTSQQTLAEAAQALIEGFVEG